MNKRFYKSERRNAEISFIVIELLAAAILIKKVLIGAWISAALIAAVAIIFAIYRLIKGPLVGLALIEVTDEELIWRQPLYIPTRIQRIRLSTIKTIRIVGPIRDRRFRIGFIDSSQQEIRPFFSWRTPKAVLFLKNTIPKHVTLIEEEPPGFMPQIRGSY